MHDNEKMHMIRHNFLSDKSYTFFFCYLFMKLF